MENVTAQCPAPAHKATHLHWSALAFIRNHISIHSFPMLCYIVLLYVLRWFGQWDMQLKLSSSHYHESHYCLERIV